MVEEEKNQKEKRAEKEAAKIKVAKNTPKTPTDAKSDKKKNKKNKSEKKDDAEDTLKTPTDANDARGVEKEKDEDLTTEKERDEKLKKDDDLPEEIKKKLEKNKIERAKKKQLKRKRGRERKTVKTGKAYIRATYNNTIVTLTDLSGNVISWANAGIAGFKGPKKATPYAAQIITKIACLKAREEYSLEEVSVFVRGVGTGRESAVRALNANGLIVAAIRDITPIPHNGCRAKKPRRV